MVPANTELRYSKTGEMRCTSDQQTEKGKKTTCDPTCQIRFSRITTGNIKQNQQSHRFHTCTKDKKTKT